MIDQFHTVNIAVHIVCAIAAFALGLWVLARAKGDRAHRRRGWDFMVAMVGVVATAAIGALGFRAAPTLMAVTALVAYELFRGCGQRGGRGPIGSILAWPLSASSWARGLWPI